MFISKQEKVGILSRIKSLEVCIDNLTQAIKEIRDVQQPAPKRKPRTEEQKAKQREYVREYKLRKQAEKAQQVAA